MVSYCNFIEYHFFSSPDFQGCDFQIFQIFRCAFFLNLLFSDRFCQGECFAPLPPQRGGCHKFGQTDDKNRFGAPVVFNPEFLEICEFVWSNRIFPEVFSAMAFDWSHQIAKRICNEGAAVDEGVVPWNRKNSKIENVMKY